MEAVPEMPRERQDIAFFPMSKMQTMMSEMIPKVDIFAGAKPSYNPAIQEQLWHV